MPVPTGGMQTRRLSPPVLLQGATIPLYEEIGADFKTALQPANHAYDDTRQGKNRTIPGDPEYHVLSTAVIKAPTSQKQEALTPYKGIKNTVLNDNPDHTVNHEPSMPENPAYEVPLPSSFEEPEYQVPPDYDQHDYAPISEQPSNEVKHEVDPQGFPSEVHEKSRGKEGAEFPIPPPRRSYSLQLQQEARDAGAYTPMDAIHSQLRQHHGSSPHTHGHAALATSKSDADLQFSLEDLTKEQLLIYIQTIQNSQPAEYMNLPSAERSDLYINIMTDNFWNVVDDAPPPLPPKPGRNASTEDMRPTVPPRKVRMPKSQSVLLPGAAAEAVRQRYQHQQRDYDSRVRFKLAEEDENIFTQYPPVPPRLRRRSENDPVQYFDTLQRLDQERPRRNIPQRSHTMIASLPSAAGYRTRYKDLEASRSKGISAYHMRDEQMKYGQRFGAQGLCVGNVASYKEHQRTGHAKNPDIHEVRSMLGNITSSCTTLNPNLKCYVHL